jgi:23S rRNA (uracil1939-C5)-methyltransferase
MAELLKARIEKIATGGAGLARIGGKSVFIEGSAPNETVLCRITKEHRAWAQAELLEVLEPSQDRVQPLCNLYGTCGGCNLQHLRYESQLTAKIGILQDSFRRIGGFTPPPIDVVSPEPGRSPAPLEPPNAWEYRNRMQFHTIWDDKPSASWGLMARKDSKIIPINDCPIADPGIRAMLRNKEKQSQLPLQQGHAATRLPDTGNPSPAAKGRFTVYARSGLFLCEGGTTRGKVRILDRHLTLDAGVFFQSNGIMLEKLVTDLKGIALNVDKSLPMADLYCGVGTFAAFLGEYFPHIDLIEENQTALSLARENLSQYKSTAFFALRSEEWAKIGVTSHNNYSFITVDPPRQGLNMALSKTLAVYGPPLLAYVSCDPATLARDSKVLVQGGYIMKELRCYDFYPQTAHIESLALFER